MCDDVEVENDGNLWFFCRSEQPYLDQSHMVTTNQLPAGRGSAHPSLAACLSDPVCLPVSNQNVDELLCCVCAANSAQEVQHFGTALVRSLQVVRERRHDITGEEMEALMAERNAALAKVRSLRSDVILAVKSLHPHTLFLAV